MVEVRRGCAGTSACEYQLAVREERQGRNTENYSERERELDNRRYGLAFCVILLALVTGVFRGHRPIYFMGIAFKQNIISLLQYVILSDW